MRTVERLAIRRPGRQPNGRNRLALLVQNPLLALDRFPEIRLRHGSVVHGTFELRQGETEREPRIPTRVQCFVGVVGFVSALQKHAGENPKARSNPEGRTPIRAFLLFALETPDADARVEPDARPCEPQTKVRALKGLLLIIGPALLPVVEGVVVIHCRMESAALQIQSETQPLVLPLEVVIVKDRPSPDDIGRELPTIRKPEICINALFAFESLPENHSRLQEERVPRSCGILSAQQRDDGLDLAGDFLVPDPPDTRVQTEILTEKRNTSLTEGVFNGVDEHARTCVAECAFSAFGVIVFGDGRGTTAAESRLEGAARFALARVCASEHAAPQALKLLGRTRKQRFVRLRRRGQTGTRQQQKSPYRQ